MSAVLTVARRELRERRFVVVTSIVVAALPLAVAHTPGLPHGEDIAQALAMVGLSFPVAAAVVIGASVVGRDSAEGRLGFYFARPLSALSLWAGKFLAALALVVVAILTTGLGAALVLNGTGALPGNRPMQDQRGVLLGLLFASVFMMGLGHAGSTFYRSRSPWRILDLASGLLLLALTAAIVRTLLFAGAGESFLLLALPLLMAGVTAAILAAAAAQLAVGRSDPRRGHRAFSITLWPLLVLMVASLWGFGVWLRSVSPAQLGAGGRVFVSNDGNGLVFLPWLWRGRAGYAPAFVMDARSGQWTTTSRERLGLPLFDAAGDMAVWIASSPDEWDPFFPATLAVARFGQGAPRIEELPLDAGVRWDRAVALDPKGERVLVTARSSAALLDVASARVLVPLPLRVLAGEFLDERTVRLYAWEEQGSAGTLVVLDWTPATRATVERMRVPSRLPAQLLHRGDVAVLAREDATVVLDVAHAGVHALPQAQARILASGDVALALRGELRMVSVAGEPVASLALPAGVSAGPMVETTPGVLAVGAFDPRAVPWWSTFFVDLRAGRILRVEKGVSPASTSDGVTAVEGHLFSDGAGGLLRILPDGTRRTLVAAPE